MRTAPVFFALMFVGAILGPPVARANGQCEALAKAAFEGDSVRAEALIASGVSVNCSYTSSYVDEDTGKTITKSSTPLNRAAWGGFSKSVRLLLSHGANVNLKDGNGYTPLYNANLSLLYLSDDPIFGMGSSDEEWEEAEEIYRLLKQAGGLCLPSNMLCNE
ncbi:MAG: hypothetical protein ISR48_01920 [Alphaproteobacteria bacterium]|nr:hypothetical protein [Alphaproteobacteria bacterium]